MTENQNIYQKAWELSSDGLLVIQHDGKVVEANESLLKILGTDLGTLKEKGVSALIEFLDSELALELKELLDPAEYTSSKSKVLRLPNNSQILLNSNLLEGSPVQFLFRLKRVGEEISFKKGLDGNVISNMSHEFNTPLNGILGVAEVIREEYLNDKNLQEYLDIIMSKGKGLKDALNDIIDVFSSDKLKKILVAAEIFDVRDLLKELHHEFSPESGKKGLALNMEMLDTPLLMKSNKALIRKLISKLISNAIQYTEKGSVSILASSRLENDKRKVRIAIKDTGIGMDEEIISKIFEPFAQGSDGINRKFVGMGLGLTMSRRLIELLNGRIKVVSTPNKGSEFALSFEQFESSSVLN